MDEEVIKKLIPAAKAGDRDAFADIYEHTKNYVYRTVYFLYEDKNEVDDIVQEIFIRIFNSLGSYNNTLAFRPWLTGITIKQVSDVRRRKWKVVRLVSKLLNLGLNDVPDVAQTVVEHVLFDQILKEVDKLSPKLKEVILLRYVHEFSQEDTAQILKIPLGTVKSRLNAALAKLRSATNLQILVKAERRSSHGF